MAVIIGILALLSLTLFGITSTARSEVIHAAETGRGEYERGVFTPGKPEFRYRFDVDEKTGKAKLTELIRLRNNEIIELAAKITARYSDAKNQEKVKVRYEVKGEKNYIEVKPMEDEVLNQYRL